MKIQLNMDALLEGIILTQEQLILGLIKGIAILALLCSMWLAIKYSHQPILDWFFFRQTQTALTAYWMCHTGFKLAYETPVAGYPWSIPFEFPIYQYLVAKLSSSFNLDLIPVGRLLSYTFLLACLIPIANIVKKLFASSWPLHFWVFAALFLSSPLYLYYGRAFMMETTALFFSLCFLYYSVLLLQYDFRWQIVLWTAFFLILALLQKATTVLPLFIVIAFIYLVRVIQLRDIRIQVGLITKSLIAFVVPLIVGYLWVYYTDWIKLQNPLGAACLLSKDLRAWNFGALAMRFSKSFWLNVFWRRIFVESVSRHLACLAIIGSLFFLSNRERKLILLSLFTFIVYFLIFANLHYIHNYYQVSNALFLICAVSLAISAMLLKFPKNSWLILGLFVLIIAGNARFFHMNAYQAEIAQFNENNSQTLAVANFIQHHTPEDKPILVYGYDWSSEIAYFSQRKSFTVPHLFKAYLDPIVNPVHYLGEKPSAVVVCGAENTAVLTQKIHQFLKPRSSSRVMDCKIYLIAL